MDMTESPLAFATLAAFTTFTELPDVLKKAEDGSGDLILRAYETAGRAVKAELTIGVLEQTIEADFQPFEIKTLRLPGQKGGEAVWTDMLEE